MTAVRLQALLARAVSVVIVLLLAGGSLLLALAPGSPGGLPLLALLVLVSLSMAELARLALGLSQVRASVVSDGAPTLSARMGRIAFALDLVVLGVMVPALLALLALVCVAVVDRLSATWPNPPASVYAVALVYLIYVAGREAIAKRIEPVLRPVGRYLRSRAPTCEVQGERIRIDLKRKRRNPASGRGEPALVEIGFHELAEVRVLTLQEANLYVARNVGPDLGLARRNVGDMVQYYRGRIDRPRVYRDTAHGTRPVLLLRGPELLYLVSAGNEDAGAVERAFDAHVAASRRTERTGSPGGDTATGHQPGGDI